MDVGEYSIAFQFIVFGSNFAGNYVYRGWKCQEIQECFWCWSRMNKKQLNGMNRFPNRLYKSLSRIEEKDVDGRKKKKKQAIVENDKVI